MTSFQVQQMNTQPTHYNAQQIEDDQMFEMPKAPRLRAQQAPVEYTHLSLPQSKDEFMSQVSQNHSCPMVSDLNLQNNNLILQSLTQQLSSSMTNQQALSDLEISQQLSF